MKTLLTLLIATLLFSCENIDDIVNREQPKEEQPKEEQPTPQPPAQPQPSTPTPAPQPSTPAPTPQPTQPTTAPTTAPITTCKAGSYDSDHDGVANGFVECHGNGKRKRVTLYHAYHLFSPKIDNVKIGSIATYRENGNLKTYINYHADGVKKHYEYTYWENGNLKTWIVYQSDGVTVSSITCYDSTSASETCTQSKHGCTSSSTTCIN